MPLAAPAGAAARPAIGAVATGDWENYGQLLTAIAGNHVVLAAAFIQRLHTIRHVSSPAT
ncbi:hypothetical protein [uncultured Chloroflexus sp.]|uniref:hypothetical protein n=1 Tax=uncultured Chloroflexus sp. TaxID=214040 RepID=UPI00260A06CC|nr:hypothetical protein [uncultured Chloroflexus sp.]